LDIFAYPNQRVMHEVVERTRGTGYGQCQILAFPSLFPRFEMLQPLTRAGPPASYWSSGKTLIVIPCFIDAVGKLMASAPNLTLELWGMLVGPNISFLHQGGRWT
jgi:hypothetical protein